MSKKKVSEKDAFFFFLLCCPFIIIHFYFPKYLWSSRGVIAFQEMILHR